MRDYSLNFKAGETRKLTLVGNSMHYVRGVGPLTFLFDSSANSGKFERDVNATLNLGRYGSVTITSEIAQSVVICLGEGESYYNGDVNIENAEIVTRSANFLVPFEDKVIAPETTALIVPANVARKELILTLSGDALSEVRIGPQDTNENRGAVLMPAATLILTTSAAIYAYNVDAEKAAIIGGIEMRAI